MIASVLVHQTCPVAGEPDAAPFICYMHADVRVDGVRGGHGRPVRQLHERAAGPRRGVQPVPPRHPPAGPLWLPALAPIYGYALESMATP